MALIAAVLSAIIALFRGGRLVGLADLFDRVRHFWLLVVPFVIVAISWIGSAKLPASVWVPVTGWLHILATIAFITFFALNRKMPGMAILAAGQALNFLPIVTNGGKMPVSGAASAIAGSGSVQGEYMRHVAMSPSTHFNWLSDIIPIPLKFLSGVISPGDVIIAVGLFILVQYAMCGMVKKPAPGVANG